MKRQQNGPPLDRVLPDAAPLDVEPPDSAQLDRAQLAPCTRIPVPPRSAHASGTHVSLAPGREARSPLELALVAADLHFWDWKLQPDQYHHASTFEGLLGRPRESLPSSFREGVRAIFDSRDWATVEDAVYQHLEGHTPRVEYEARLASQSNTPRWVQGRGKVVERDAASAPLRVTGTHQDITVRRRADAERAELQLRLQNAQKLESLAVLAGGIAHDFNNLLCGVLGHADLVLLDTPSSEPAYESLNQIRSSALRASELCRQMLAYSGRGHFWIAPLSLNTLVEEMAQLLHSAVSRKAQLRFHLDTNLPKVQGDSSQLRQVLLNLVVNASEALEDRSGSIHIRTAQRTCSRRDLASPYAPAELAPGLYAALEVTDTGCGMDETTRERLFDPFFSTKFMGRGLGLAAVIGIVRGHRGAIQVETQPGAGTLIRVLLPASAGVGLPSAEPVAMPFRPRTVLLVDDEDPVRQIAKRLLEHLGMTVVAASDGLEGLATFRAHGGKFCLVLVDLTMPGMDGAELFHAIRKEDPEVPVVITSGYPPDDAIGRLERLGLAGFLKKPFRLDEVRSLLSTVAPATNA
jgi:signal transduction histidine kinase/ActR/RegA family two-component response regulator